MKTSPPRATSQDIPRPDIEIGDSVYFAHPERGHMSARVIARGQHGCTAACHLGDLYRIHWDKIIGIKEQSKKKFTMIERGHDGVLVEDDQGQRHYIETATAELEAQKQQEKTEKKSPTKKPLHKTLPAGILLIKSQVKAHTRHSPSGKIVAVNPYTNKKMKSDQGTMDLFRDTKEKVEPAPLPAEERIRQNSIWVDTVKAYIGSGYANINRSQRDPEEFERRIQKYDPVHAEETRNKYSTYVNDLREMFELAPLRDLSDLWRGDGGAVIKKLMERAKLSGPDDEQRFGRVSDESLKKLIGMRFQDKGFVSTSKSRSVATQFDFTSDYYKTIFHFTGSAQALDLKKIHQINTIADEEEVLLKNGLTFEVTDAQWESPTDEQKGLKQLNALKEEIKSTTDRKKKAELKASLAALTENFQSVKKHLVITIKAVAP